MQNTIIQGIFSNAVHVAGEVARSCAEISCCPDLKICLQHEKLSLCLAVAYCHKKCWLV